VFEATYNDDVETPNTKITYEETHMNPEGNSADIEGPEDVTERLPDTAQEDLRGTLTSGPTYPARKAHFDGDLRLTLSNEPGGISTEDLPAADADDNDDYGWEYSDDPGEDTMFRDKNAIYRSVADLVRNTIKYTQSVKQGAAGQIAILKTQAAVLQQGMEEKNRDAQEETVRRETGERDHRQDLQDLRADLTSRHAAELQAASEKNEQDLKDLRADLTTRHAANIRDWEATFDTARKETSGTAE
jgi:hypothetical protein